MPKFHVISGTQPITVRLDDVTHNLVPLTTQSFDDLIIPSGSNTLVFTGTGEVEIIFRGGDL